MTVLYATSCPTCGPGEEFLPVGTWAGVCSRCGAAVRRVPTAPLVTPPNFGKAMAQHRQGRRLSPEERERREHWNRTRLKGQAPPDKTPKPTIVDLAPRPEPRAAGQPAGPPSG